MSNFTVSSSGQGNRRLTFQRYYLRHKNTTDRLTEMAHNNFVKEAKDVTSCRGSLCYEQLFVLAQSIVVTFSLLCLSG